MDTRINELFPEPLSFKWMFAFIFGEGLHQNDCDDRQGWKDSNQKVRHILEFSFILESGAYE
jgi:hypothetical protein